MKKRGIALLIAAVLLLTPALALAFDPSNIDIDEGNVSIDTTETRQITSSGVTNSGAHGGSVKIYSTSCASNPNISTNHTVAIDTSGGTLNVAIQEVKFATDNPSESFINITGDGTVNLALEGVSIYPTSSTSTSSPLSSALTKPPSISTSTAKTSWPPWTQAPPPFGWRMARRSPSPAAARVMN